VVDGESNADRIVRELLEAQERIEFPESEQAGCLYVTPGLGFRQRLIYFWWGLAYLLRPSSALARRAFRRPEMWLDTNTGELKYEEGGPYLVVPEPVKSALWTSA
jgi:hypothetical protein